MPEGDTIFRTARTLHRVLAGQLITRFETVFPHLSRVDVDSSVTGRTVERVEAHGKWLLIYFTGDLILLTHMLMSGSWHIYRPGEPWQRSPVHMRIILETQKFLAVAFNVQIAEFHSTDSLRRRAGFNTLGQSLLATQFNDAEAIARLRSHPDFEVGAALLKQSVVAGIGNVFKSEICFACQVNPFRQVRSLTNAEASALISTARKFLQANVAEASALPIPPVGAGLAPPASTPATLVTHNLDRHPAAPPTWPSTIHRRTTTRLQPEENLYVYHRTGHSCRRCNTPIESRPQGPEARSTYWCPQCQPMHPASIAAIA